MEKKLRVKVKSTGEELTVRHIGDLWYADEKGDTYHQEDLLFSTTSIEETTDSEDSDGDVEMHEKFLECIVKKCKEQDQAVWRAIRVELVMKFIDIYQAPLTNMKEIFTLSDMYIKELKKREHETAE